MKEKYFHMFGKAVDSTGEEHIVTVVGKFEQFTERTEKVVDTTLSFEDDDRSYDGVMFVPYKQTIRNLKLGYSICHPNDEFNEEIGVELAKSRIKHGNYIGELTTHNITMLNDDQCNLNVFGELQYIINHIDKYLPTNDTTEDETLDDAILDTEYDDNEILEETPDFDSLPDLN